MSQNSAETMEQKGFNTVPLVVGCIKCGSGFEITIDNWCSHILSGGEG